MTSSAQKQNAERVPLDEALIARFAAIVGPDQALQDAAETAPYLRERRGLFVGTTPLLLKPGSTREVADILRLASEFGVAVVPQGGNTGLVGGQIPHAGANEVVLNLSRLNRVREVDGEGAVMVVEAGVTLAEARATAEEAGFMFPLSLASEGSCQIGGVLATNAGGVNVLAYGNARDLALGLEVVLADGQVWEGLRRLKKDNTGYDLRDLFIGSEGTLGVITTAVLRLFPKPRETAVALAGLASLGDAAGLYEMARAAAGPTLTAFEILPRTGLELVLRHAPGTRDPLAAPHPWYALIEISERSAGGSALGAMETLLADAFERGCAADAVLAASLGQGADIWALRERMSDVQKLEGGSIKNDISVPVARIPEFIERANSEMARLVPGCRPVPFGHYGDGNIHYNITQPEAADQDAFLAEWDRLTGAVNALVLEFGGSISAEHGIGQLKRGLLGETKSEIEMDLMRRIKAALDPQGLLNPGKVL